MIRSETRQGIRPELLENLRQRYPLRKIAERRDVTTTSIFLASSETDFYTRQTMAPAGGEVMV